jgi:DMSO/TMAO reductase YedYZ heme-binding membrane subunit
MSNVTKVKRAIGCMMLFAPCMWLILFLLGALGYDAVERLLMSVGFCAGLFVYFTLAVSLIESK